MIKTSELSKLTKLSMLFIFKRTWRMEAMAKNCQSRRFLICIIQCSDEDDRILAEKKFCSKINRKEKEREKERKKKERKFSI